MSLYTVVFGQVSQPQDINQVVNVLAQPSGGQEKGKYFIAGPLAASGNVVAGYIVSLSRNSVPVSVSIDEADQGHIGGMNASPSTGALSANGFQVFSLNTTGPAPNARAGGNYTIQY